MFIKFIKHNTNSKILLYAFRPSENENTLLIRNLESAQTQFMTFLIVMSSIKITLLTTPKGDLLGNSYILEGEEIMMKIFLSPLSIESTLKGKNLLPWEQILSF